MKYLGAAHTKKLSIICLKFKINWTSCIFTCQIWQTLFVIPLTIQNVFGIFPLSVTFSLVHELYLHDTVVVTPLSLSHLVLQRILRQGQLLFL